MLYTDFIFWLEQQPPEIQQRTIFEFIGLFAIMLVIGIITEYIRRKRENKERLVDKIRQDVI